MSYITRADVAAARNDGVVGPRRGARAQVAFTVTDTEIGYPS